MNKLNVLKDILEDFLELRARLSGQTSQPIQNFLFSQSLRQFEVMPVEGFRLDRSLVLFEKGSPSSIENLVFLRPRNGVFRVTRIAK